MAYSTDPVRDAAEYTAALYAESNAFEAVLPHAEECLCGDLDVLGNWIAWQAGTPRQPSRFFGEISVQELVLMVLKPSATQQQVREAAQELRARYLKQHKKAVQRIAEEML